MQNKLEKTLRLNKVTQQFAATKINTTRQCFASKLKKGNFSMHNEKGVNEILVMSKLLKMDVERFVRLYKDPK